MRLSLPVRAALTMTACCAFISLSTFFAKMLGSGAGGEPMHAFQIVLGRYGFALIALAPFMLASGAGFRGAPWRLYAGRAVFGTAGVSGLFAAAAMIPLADATAISFLNPVFAMILAIFFLGERVGRVRWTAAGIALAGGIVLIRPGAQAIEPGALIALAAAVFMAAEIIFAKLLSRTENVVRLLFITNGMAVCLSAAAASFVWRAPTGFELALMAAVGLSMVTAQALFMATIKFTDASFATPFFYGALVFAAAYDLIWFGVAPAPASLLGAGLIIAGAVILALREARVSSGEVTPPSPIPPASGPRSPGAPGGQRAPSPDKLAAAFQELEKPPAPPATDQAGFATGLG